MILPVSESDIPDSSPRNASDSCNPSLYEEHGHDHGDPGQEEEGGTAGHSVDHRVWVHHLNVQKEQTTKSVFNVSVDNNDLYLLFNSDRKIAKHVPGNSAYPGTASS